MKTSFSSTPLYKTRAALKKKGNNATVFNDGNATEDNPNNIILAVSKTNPKKGKKEIAVESIQQKINFAGSNKTTLSEKEHSKRISRKIARKSLMHDETYIGMDIGKSKEEENFESDSKTFDRKCAKRIYKKS